MSDSTGQSREIMASARRSLVEQRAGGRRLQPVGKPIGKGSARLRRQTWKKRLGYFAATLAAIVVAGATSVAAGIA